MHVVATAGHVDHGKSTLVRALTGIDPDRWGEEKRLGLTIDLGFAWMTLPSGAEIGFVDVPGHERFIRNMLAGVGSVSAALFVVAADEGWNRQSGEHLEILDYLQLSAGLVVLTKTDTASPQQIDLVMQDIARRVAGTFLENSDVIPVSAKTGEGIDRLKDALDDLLSSTEPPEDRERPRLFVDRSFAIAGAGTVVTGTLTGGRLLVGQELEVAGSAIRVRIRGLQTHGSAADRVGPGTRVAVNLAGIERTQLSRGDALVEPDRWEMGANIAARLRAGRNLSHPLTEKGAYELHLGSAQVPCRFKFFEKGKLAPGDEILAKVIALRPLPFEPGDRFVIRDLGRWETVAGGEVLEISTATLDRLELLRHLKSSGLGRVASLLQVRKVVARSELGRLTSLTDAQIQSELSSGVATPGYVFARSHFDALAAAIIEALGEHHRCNPLALGMPRTELQAHLELEPKPFTEILDELVARGSTAGERDVVRLPGHEPQLTTEQRQKADTAVESLQRAGTSPPVLDLPSAVIRVLEQNREIVKVSPGLVFAAVVVEDTEARIVRLIDECGPVTVAQVRDAIGTSRKYAVPLLEYFDSSGLTVRRGDTRVLGPRGRKLAPPR